MSTLLFTQLKYKDDENVSEYHSCLEQEYSFHKETSKVVEEASKQRVNEAWLKVQ